MANDGENPLECIRWKSKYGTPTHYCFGNPVKDCPPAGQGCALSQFKPVHHRMLNRARRGDDGRNMSGKDGKQGYRMAPPRLTGRQVEILNLIKLGLTNEEIACKLRITESAVSNRILRGVFSRLGASNRAHAIYIAMKRGIIS